MRWTVNYRARVSGTQLSCASVGDQLAIIGKVSQGMTGQRNCPLLMRIAITYNRNSDSLICAIYRYDVTRGFFLFAAEKLNK